MKVILSVIAVCLVMITAKLYLPEASAEVAGLNSYELRADYDFREAVESIVEECQFSGTVQNDWVFVNTSC